MSCPLCWYQNPREITLKETRYGTGKEFAYLECTNCNSLKIKEVPNDLGSYYRDSYYSFETPTKRGRFSLFMDKCRVSSGLMTTPIRTLRPDHTLQALAPLPPSQRILDVGCGSGQIVSRLRDLGHNAHGIDPFVKSETRYVTRKTIDEVKTAWDVILLSHSLEHMPDQIETLNKLRALLAQDGKLIVRIPLLGWAWNTYRENWVELDAPRHLFLHSYYSFTVACGVARLKISKTIYDSTNFEYLASEQIKAGVPLDEQRGYGRLESLRGSLLVNRLNRRRESGRASFVLKALPQ